ncbi:MAG: glycoside hydrolase family 9 protein, partial [Gammaproteobacteria bacterium]|nr:glycoside hydrolase family 9 protein [Gammaproteobacteria bacterium]
MHKYLILLCLFSVLLTACQDKTVAPKQESLTSTPNDLNRLSVEAQLINPRSKVNVEFNYRVLNDWDTGFKGNIVLQNKGAVDIDDWSLKVSMNADIQSVDGGTVRENTSNSFGPGAYSKVTPGDKVVINDYLFTPQQVNTRIPAGGEVTINFISNKTTGDARLSSIVLYDLSSLTESGPVALQEYLVTEPAADEISLVAKLIETEDSGRGTRVHVRLIDERAIAEKESSSLVFRYFFDLSEIIALNSNAEIQLETYHTNGGSLKVSSFNGSKTQYYVEGLFYDPLIPQDIQTKQWFMDFFIGVPVGNTGWVENNDYSFLGLTFDSSRKTSSIVLYDMTLPQGQQIILGSEPVWQSGEIIGEDTTPVIVTPVEPTPVPVDPVPAPVDPVPAPVPVDPTPTPVDPVPAPVPVTPPSYTGFGPAFTPEFNYSQALQMSWLFYEAQRSGPLPQYNGDLVFFDPRTGNKLHNGFLANRVPWRGDSDTDDGKDLGLDLSGGWHDAGGHVKYGLPMAFSASFLAWGVIEFETALQNTGQLKYAKDNLRWVGDYFLRAHPEPNVLYGQVGSSMDDLSIWGPPEVMPHARPASKIDLQHPGPDLAAQTAAALAAISMVFKNDEPEYASVLLQHAVELYEFAKATITTDKNMGRYSDSITDAQNYYSSYSGAKDDIPFAAGWLYLASKSPNYLHDAENNYTRIAGQSGYVGWTANWDDVRYATYILMAKVHADPSYNADSLILAEDKQNGFFDYDFHSQNFLNYWLNGTGVERTPGGMAWLSGKGSARYSTMTGFLALVYRQHLISKNSSPVLQENYLNFATEQANYVLGDNPLGMSYMVGFGNKWSQVANHRASHGSSTNNIYDPMIPRHILYGALVGGPNIDDTYTEDRANVSLTNVSNDTNAGFNGLLAGLVDAHGSEPVLSVFPVPEV